MPLVRVLLCVLILIAGSFVVSGGGGSCSRTHVRKEYRDLSREDWDAFRTTLKSLQSTKSPDGRANFTEWDWWTQIHVDNMMLVHGTAVFFPWHRAYILALERRLQSINPRAVIPFWDWTFDYQRPLDSPIFSPSFGLDVELGRSGDCRYERQVFTKHCLARDYDPSNFTTYYPPDAVSEVIFSTEEYDTFRELIEMVPHAIVHTSLGGAWGDMALMNSPNDPIFFLHHSMIDYIWWIWQGRDGQKMTAYEGDVGAIMSPFNMSVADVFDTAKLCYTYQPFSLGSLAIGRHA